MPVVELDLAPPVLVIKKPVIKPVAVRSEVIGRSVANREITMHVFGDDSKPVVLVFGGIHGEEGTAASTAESLVSYLRKNLEFCRGRCIAVIPRLNPDGLNVHRRVNNRGVDLNRNFPAHNFKACVLHGSHPASEPETRALVKVMNLLQPVRIMSIHSCRRGRHGNNWDGPAAKIAESMSQYNNYKHFGTWHNPTPGSFGNWAGVDKKIPVITLELPNDLSASRCWKDNREAILDFLRTVSPGE